MSFLASLPAPKAAPAPVVETESAAPVVETAGPGFKPPAYGQRKGFVPRQAL